MNERKRNPWLSDPKPRSKRAEISVKDDVKGLADEGLGPDHLHDIYWPYPDLSYLDDPETSRRNAAREKELALYKELAGENDYFA